MIFLTGSSPTALEILTPATLPFGAVNAAYSQTLAAAGGTTPYTWSVTAGALPAGVTLSSAGLLSGTPTVTGTFNFTARVTDGASATTTRAFTLKINTVTALSFTTGATLRSGVVGAAYEDGISVTGGTAPYTQAVTAGAPPTGLGLGSNGLVSGTPTTVGTFTFTSTVTDAVGATASRNFSITIAATGPSITTTTLPNGAVGTAYSQALAVSGGTSPYTWSIFSGALPGGLTLSSAGVLSGTPAAAGTFNITVRVTDALGATATQTFTLTVLPEPIPPTPVVLGSGNIQLSWPTTTGFRYQVEWSPDLTQWSALGTPTLSNGTAMTWTDDGSQTGTAPPRHNPVASTACASANRHEYARTLSPSITASPLCPLLSSGTTPRSSLGIYRHRWLANSSSAPCPRLLAITKPMTTPSASATGCHAGCKSCGKPAA